TAVQWYAHHRDASFSHRPRDERGRGIIVSQQHFAVVQRLEDGMPPDPGTSQSECTVALGTSEGRMGMDRIAEDCAGAPFTTTLHARREPFRYCSPPGNPVAWGQDQAATVAEPRGQGLACCTLG